MKWVGENLWILMVSTMGLNLIVKLGMLYEGRVLENRSMVVLCVKMVICGFKEKFWQGFAKKNGRTVRRRWSQVFIETAKSESDGQNRSPILFV
jgi:metal-sulfur cluster biosynthetic enzyme